MCPISGWERPNNGAPFTAMPTPTPVPTVMYATDLEALQARKSRDVVIAFAHIIVATKRHYACSGSHHCNTILGLSCYGRHLLVKTVNKLTVCCGIYVGIDVNIVRRNLLKGIHKAGPNSSVLPPWLWGRSYVSIPSQYQHARQS